MDMSLLLMFLFIIKHFLCDFVFQGPYQFLNKGTYGHPGGLLHTGINVFGSFNAISAAWLISLPLSGIALDLSFMTVMLVLLIETIVHYHTDWLKVNLNKKFGWEPNTHKQFWYLLGADQFIHYMTYVVMIWLLV